jgi:glycosyltransferase involved in cell wall biosynthesis
MKIAVHASHMCQDREDGNQTYIKNLFSHLGQIDSSNEYWFYYNKENCQKFEAPNFRHISRSGAFAWTQFAFPSQLRQDKPDLLFMPIQMLPFLTPSSIPTVVTIHDVAFEFFPKTYPLKDLVRHKLYVRRALAKADHLISITNATKDDLIRIYGVPEEKITTVYHGLDHDRFHIPREAQDAKKTTEVKKKYNITKPYLLYVGNVQPRKNVQGLIKAFASLEELSRKFQLVIAGAQAWLVEDVMSEISDISTKDDIIFTGRFENDDLSPLFWGATAFVLPSFYEGFGLPILEAAACGTPVMIANTPSMVEVAGKAGVSFDPHSISSIARTLHSVLTDTRKQVLLRQEGLERVKEFTWHTTAKKTLEVLQEAYEKSLKKN